MGRRYDPQRTREIVLRAAFRDHGCPLNNLAEEMSPLDEGFRKRLAKVFHEWQAGIASALRKGQSRGTVRRDVDPRQTASFLIATYEGYLSLAKNNQNVKVLRIGISSMVGWLRTLCVTNKRVYRRTARQRN